MHTLARTPGCTTNTWIQPYSLSWWRTHAVAAAEAGKHIWVEKPAGRHAGETAEIADAVHATGVQSAAGFNYRNAPAIELARQLIADGRIGAVASVNIRLLTDYAAHPRGALTWRFLSDL